MNRFSKLTAFILALILLLSVFTGCKLPDNTVTPITIESETEETTATPEITPVPTPEFEVSQSAADAFQALDLDVFRWHATVDGYALHMFVDDPAKFGIDPATVPMTLGEFTEEDTVLQEQKAAVFFERLNEINREQLPEEMQFSYDVLHDILADYSMDTTAYAYMYEPLTEYSGVHSSLPLSFALFELKDAGDVEDYLSLLADMPRYMGQILAYEQKRAELNMFMTDDALDAILEDCEVIIDTADTSFLYATFNDAIDQLTDLTPEQAQSYKDRNASLLKNEYINSYVTLYDGLKALRKSCRTYAEAVKYTDTQREYFEYRMQGEGCNSLSVEETLEMLKTESNYLMYDILALQDKYPNIYSEPKEISSGNMQEDIDYLKTVIAQLLPELPAHNLTLSDVPEELQDQFAPAAYVIPAMDDWTENTIYINTVQEDPTILLTLAHEGYPGHLYQYVYQRSLDNVGLMQRVENFGGYAEGWAQFAEFLISEYQTKYDQDYLRYMFEISIYSNTIVPAIVSILVNYYGYSTKAVENFLTGSGFPGEETAMLFYNMVIDQPYYYLEYAIGYAQLAQLYRDELSDLGGSFRMNDFLKTYLDLGPGNFDLIKEQMDIWADKVVQDAA